MTERWLQGLHKKDYTKLLTTYGEEGVKALSQATPSRTGLTANSWYYEIRQDPGCVRIDWLNSNVHDGVNIAILLQYGHATGNGGYVEGIDYINPAMRSVFEKLAGDLWEEVNGL